MEKKNKKKALLAASIVGLMAVAGTTAAPGSALAAQAGMEKCYGINKCAGTGACGSKKYGHACAGENSCKGKAWLYVPEETCTKINGGSLTEV